MLIFLYCVFLSSMATVVVAANFSASQAPPNVNEQTRFSMGLNGSPMLTKRLPT